MARRTGEVFFRGNGYGVMINQSSPRNERTRETNNTRERTNREQNSNETRQTFPAVTRDYSRTASARGVPRGITISQESLDAFRRRRDASNGSVSG